MDLNEGSAIQLHSGNKMPVFGLGTWQLTIDTAGSVAYAIKLGYRLIDTSSDYQTQPGIGEAIKRSGIPRKEIYITTKVEETDNAYERTKSNLEELDLDYVDLMLIHRPPPMGAGEDLWEGLIRAKKEGLIRDIGVSNYSAELINGLIEASGEIPTVNQIEWSPFGHSDEMLKYCKERKIIIQAYSPLTRTKRLSDEILSEVAARYKKSPAQILIHQKPHLEEDIDVFNFEIEDKDMRILEDLNENYSSLGGLPYI